MNAVMQHVPAHIEQLFEAVAREAEQADVFEDVALAAGRVDCLARNTPEPVHYRAEYCDGGLYVNWLTPDRYLSQSIEAELMWTGDDLADMIDEELVDQGWSGGKLGDLEHYRNEDRQFTFRSRLPIDASRIDLKRHATDIVRCLLAYEAAFRELGDMSESDDE